MTTLETLSSVAKELDAKTNSDDVLLTNEFAKEMDKRDPLKDLRNEFYIPKFEKDGVEKEKLYFVGNSLGLQPKTTQSVLNEEMERWRNCGVDGHFTGERPWVKTDDYVLDEAAKIVGARKDEIAVMNTLTVNLHLLMVSFYKPTEKKHKILIESDAFPSDWYATASQIQLHGFEPEKSLIRLKPREGEYCVREEDVEERLKAEDGAVALVLWPGVQYYTGQFFDLEKLAKSAHKYGAMFGTDLAHAAGNVPLKLHDWDVDFAAWGHYKYLNSGPGAIAGAFVHAKHSADLDAKDPKQPHRLAGWWGHDLKTRFQMRDEFTPIPGAYGWRLSNPPVVAVACVLGSFKLWSSIEGGMDALRKKSLLLTGYFYHLMNVHVRDAYEEGTLRILTPEDESKRGCQLSLMFGGKSKPRDIFERLEANGAVVDFREPDTIRAAPVPCYNTFQDVREFVKIVIDELELLKVPKRSK